jgi:hypothetical protein
MYATAQCLLRRRPILETVKFRAKAIVRNVSVRADTGSADGIAGFLDQMNRGRK